MPKLEATDFEKGMVELVGVTAKPGRHCASNAIEHLKRASLLESADAGMATFRAITAEEEASTALFHSIKRHKYPGAKALNPRNHVHKNAVTHSAKRYPRSLL